MTVEDTMRLSPLALASLVPMICLLAAAPVMAAPPLLGYSGRLTSSAGGAPLVGPVDLTVALYDVAVGGTSLFVEAHDGTELIDGGFTLLINSVAVEAGFEALFAGRDDLWLELTVDGEVLSPRLRLTAAPWSLSVPAHSHEASALPASLLYADVDASVSANLSFSTAPSFEASGAPFTVSTSVVSQ